MFLTVPTLMGRLADRPRFGLVSPEVRVMHADRAVRYVFTHIQTRCGILALSFILSVATGPPVAAQAPPPADSDVLDQAVDAGVRFLKRSQNPKGHWGTGSGPGSGKGWAVGYTSLAGLALVECGTPPSDPGLRRAADGIRLYATRSEIDSTYEVSLAILFLDRMGDKGDKKLIQTLAARLIAGQTATGGWGYAVPKHSAAEGAALLAALRKMSPPAPTQAPSARDRPLTMGLCIKTSDETFVRAPPPFDPDRARKDAVAVLPAALKKCPVVETTENQILEDTADKKTDNSNTHFATIGLWAARKHDVPTDRSFSLLVRRFKTSQGPDGSWGYPYVRNGAAGPPQMTCVALLGLAIGHVIEPDPNIRPEKDPKVVKAFVSLSKRIGEPAGTTADRPSLKDAGGLYFMWAMERVAVLYDLRQLDKKDWHQWGVEILLGHQSTDGSWAEDGGYHGQSPVLNTCFALLFLKRANLTPDLSRRLAVDTSALAAKVDTKPKVEPPPEPKVETPVVVEPPPQVEAPPPVVSQPVVETPATAKAEVKGFGTIWIVLIILLGVVGLGIAIFAVLRMKKENAHEKPKKKGTKKKVRVKAEEDE